MEKTTDLSIRDLTLTDVWTLIKTFLTFSLGFIVFYKVLTFSGLVFGVASTTGSTERIIDSSWIKAAILISVLVLLAKYLPLILSVLGRDCRFVLSHVREYSFVGRLGVVLIAALGIYSLKYAPLIFWGVVLPVFGVMDAYDTLKRERDETAQKHKPRKLVQAD